MNSRPAPGASWDKAVVGTCIAVILMGLTVIAGWHLHIRAAVQILQGMVPMQYNTALCLVALGVAGIGLSMRKPTLLVPGAALAALMGGAVTLEYLAGVSFGIDTLFFYPWEVMLSADAGRMSLTAAISCFLSGMALLVLAVRGDAYGVFGIINSLPLSLALTSLIGYAFQITYVLPFRLGTQMALTRRWRSSPMASRCSATPGNMRIAVRMGCRSGCPGSALR